MDVERVRQDFPILKKQHDGKPIVYLDSTATSLIPSQVVDACCQYFHGAKANIHRGVHKMSEEASRVFDDATKTTAKFINAKPEEMIFTRNATESINTVMYSLFVDDYFKKGDEIVTTIMEHHSNFVPWQFLRDKVGINLKVVEVNDDFTLNMQDLESKVTDKTKMVAVSHASNTIGTINDVQEICKIAHEKNSYCLIDGAQSTPHFKIDVKKIDADFFAFSGHKMLAPSGISGLYGKKDILEKMPPFLYGGGMIKDVTIEKSTWADLPGKFEAGTPDIAGAYGMKAAVEYLEKIGMDEIRNHEKELINHALDRIQEIKGINIYTPKDATKQVGIVLFTVDGMDSHDVALALDEAENIAIRSGYHCAHPLMSRLDDKGLARASFYLYNTIEEIDLFIDTLKIITDAFAK